MNVVNGRPNWRPVRNIRLWSVSLLLFSAACASHSRLHAFKVPPGSIRLAQVMALGSREEIIKSGAFQNLTTSGIKDADIADQSVAVARVYCCGGPPEQSNALWFYIPPGLEVTVGDIVEVRNGPPPDKDTPGTPNIAVRVRQKAHAPDGTCRWDPPNELLWMRILYCDGMEQEGWIEQTGLYKTWLKPAAPGSIVPPS